jgi:phosphotransferase system enzyme I (PtsI)
VSTRALAGIGVSPGYAGGPVARLGHPPTLPATMPAQLAPRTEIDRALAALETVATDLDARAAQSATAEAAAVLGATAMIARDSMLAETIEAKVAQGLAAAWALDAAIAEHRDVLVRIGGYIAERASDLDDVRDRALALLLGVPMPGVPDLPQAFVLVADDLAPADTATLKPGKVLGIITSRGGPTSHTAILARALGLPAVVACAGAATLVDGDLVVLDGGEGTVTADASPTDVRDAALREMRRRAARAAVTGPGRTKDGHPVKLLLNIGQPDDALAMASTGAEGVGLFRTEFLYLGRETAPTVEEQQHSYEELLAIADGRRVVVRTLDAGSDKPLAFLTPADEPNPALGTRGYRTARQHPGVLRDQLQAIANAVKASHAPSDVWVMAPMIATAGEAEEFASMARGHGLPVAGVMIEIPAAALRAVQIGGVVDFLSLGTNDLAQYTFAADRTDGELADLLNHWQPALLELIGIAAGSTQVTGKPVGVCGESAADPTLAVVLAGLGVSSLSMSRHAIADVRASLASLRHEDCVRIAQAAVAAPDAATARAIAAEALAAG